MTVNLYLDTSSSAVLAVVQHKGKKFRISTGEVIKPSTHWDSEQQKVKSSFKDYSSINKNLSSYKDKIKKIIRDYQTINNTLPTLDYVKNEINKDPNTSTKTFNNCLEKFLERSKTENMLSTFNDYRYIINSYKKFEKDKKIALSFENLNHETIDLLKKYLVEKRKSPSTIKKHLRYFIIILNFAKSNSYIKDFNEQIFDFKATERQGNKIYLTTEEVNAIIALKLQSKILENARNIFLFQILTGLRYSDVRTLRQQNIRNDHIDIVMHKTRSRLYIPLSEKAKAILQKCKDDHPLKCFNTLSTLSQINNIRELCKKANIRIELPIVRYVGKERIDETFQKWELVGTHTGRRTFATNFLLSGGKIEILSKLLGHSDIRVTQRYFRHNPEIIAEMAKQYIE